MATNPQLPLKYTKNTNPQNSRCRVPTQLPGKPTSKPKINKHHQKEKEAKKPTTTHSMQTQSKTQNYN